MWSRKSKREERESHLQSSTTPKVQIRDPREVSFVLEEVFPRSQSEGEEVGHQLSEEEEVACSDFPEGAEKNGEWSCWV